MNVQIFVDIGIISFYYRFLSITPEKAVHRVVRTSLRRLRGPQILQVLALFFNRSR